MNDNISGCIGRFLRTAAVRDLKDDDFRELCEALNVSKLYYDIDLGDGGRYRDHLTKKRVFSENEIDGKIMLYDNGEKTDLRLIYPYYYEGLEYVHAYTEFREGITLGDVDSEVFQLAADLVYLIASRQNMRSMLDFAEMTDAQTGIPNVVHIGRRFAEAIRRIPPENFFVMYINLQNFKYINETAGAKCGDEAIVQYSRILPTLTDPDECVCRMGGDNFAMYLKKEHLSDTLRKLESISIGHLDTAPGRSFEISSWIGITEIAKGDTRPFNIHLDEAAIACSIGKTRLKRSVVFYTEELKMMMNRGREIMAMFRPAVRNREFLPFFQAKVDMRTGELVGFEALCRWMHEGRFIYPNQFIPVLDKEGLIHELDMAIFRETCASIKHWKDMGLTPPRISSNFSRKNLFVPGIESKIFDVIKENGIDVSDIEIEITESVKEAETDRLIDFVRNLKELGLHISIDDFGTGYSSLMLIHNIDADVIKIDKSFIDNIPGDHKSEVLIESIISIAHNLDMQLIAEGVETAEQGRELLKLGCPNAQGYFYSKPASFDEATELIRNPPFKPIES
ncbi:MAG: GGDEF domain-containing protein [Ruminiclostridium sp.]|nr:GGDEF domain-containing protein [Ruminiclostridium sp.]